MFSAVAETFTVDIPFDTDGAYSIAFDFKRREHVFAHLRLQEEHEAEGAAHVPRFERRRCCRPGDPFVRGKRSLGKQRSLYEVHFGTPTPDGIVFARDVSMTIRPRGTAGGLQPWGYSSQWFQDLDGDGKTDILFKDVKTGLTGMSRAMLGKSIAIDLECYRTGADRTYPDKPTTRRKIRPALDIFEKHRVFFPVVLLGDVNGDGRSDLLIGKHWEELHVFLGRSGTGTVRADPSKGGSRYA